MNTPLLPPPLPWTPKPLNLEPVPQLPPPGARLLEPPPLPPVLSSDTPWQMPEDAPASAIPRPRGRPRAAASKRHKTRFGLLVTEREKEKLDEIAEAFGLTWSGTVRRLLLDAYRELKK